MAGRALARFKRLVSMQAAFGGVLRQFSSAIPPWVDERDTSRFPRARAWRDARTALYLAAVRVSALVADHADQRNDMGAVAGKDANVEAFLDDFVNRIGGERLADLDFGEEWGDPEDGPDGPLTNEEIALLIADHGWDPDSGAFVGIAEGDPVGEWEDGAVVERDMLLTELAECLDGPALPEAVAE